MAKAPKATAEAPKGIPGVKGSKANKPVEVKTSKSPQQLAKEIEDAKAAKAAKKAEKAEKADKGAIARSEFSPTAKITLLVPLEQIIAKRRGNPAVLYGHLEDGMTVQDFMDKIRPLKGTLAEIRKALHHKEISVEGIDSAQYEVIHGTACTPCGPAGSPKPEVKARAPKEPKDEDEDSKEGETDEGDEDEDTDEDEDEDGEED